MNFKEILELIDKVAERGIAGVEIEQAGTRIRVEGKATQQQVIHSYGAGEQGPTQTSVSVPSPAVTPTPAQAAAAVAKAEQDIEDGLHILTSPIVGTFYRSPNPEADLFVNVGDRVTKGKVLCIVEAMKLMNEIEADVDGVVTRIYPQNGQPVEYGEKLFAVKLG